MLTRRTLLQAPLLTIGTLPLSPLAAGQTAHRLTILHMNDFHSRHEPVDGRALACAPGQDGCYGGSPRLAAAIRAGRAAAEADGRAVLLLDAGDQFQGSLFFTAHEGRAERDVMHAVGTEAMAIGNHEFDRGPAVLAAFIRNARFPVLAANLDVSADPDLAGLVRPYVLVERGGLRLAVIGLTTQEAATSSSPGPHIRFDPPGPALEAAARAARAEGAALVIALSHLGVFLDRQLAGQVPGVGVFVGGHSHTLLSNAEPGALGPHPVLADGPAGRALVVQAACYGRFLGRLDLDVAADGTVLAWGGDVHHVGLDGPEDPEVAAIVARYAAPLEALRRNSIATLPNELDIATCRFEECAFGNLAADALLHAAHGADLALMNAGGLRTGLPSGPVTLGAVLDALPFGNSLATLSLPGAELRAVLEHGLGLLGRGGFPQVAGLRITWDASRPVGQRVLAVEVRDAAGGWAPLDPRRVYRIATNDFMRRGGDGYVALRDAAIDPYDSGPGLADLVAAEIGRGQVPDAGRLLRP